MNKARWIEHIESLLKTDESNNVSWLEYENDKDAGEEYIYIHYKNGYIKMLNATANSNATNLIEITKAVYY